MEELKKEIMEKKNKIIEKFQNYKLNCSRTANNVIKYEYHNMKEFLIITAYTEDNCINSFAPQTILQIPAKNICITSLNNVWLLSDEDIKNYLISK